VRVEERLITPLCRLGVLCILLALKRLIMGHRAQQAARSSTDRSLRLLSCVRRHVCGALAFIAVIKTVPHLLLEPGQLFLSLSPSPFYLPLLLFNSSSPQFSTSPSRACSLRLPPANTNTRTHPRPATNPKQESMDLVAPSEHLCYVRCTFCDTVLAVNSSRNRIRSKQHMCGDHAWRSRRVIARHVISFAL
jgi:hypothetical protein